MRFDKRMIRLAAVLAVSAFGLTASPSSAGDFRGGGALYGFTGCEAQGWSGASMVLARLTTVEGGTNVLVLNLSNGGGGGTLVFRIDAPIARSFTWRGTQSFAVWGEVERMRPNPRTRIAGVAFTAPRGATLATATDMRLRLQIRRFNWIPSCQASVTLALHSTPG